MLGTSLRKWKIGVSPLNIVILKKTSDVRTWSFGIDDEEFHQRKPEKGLLTKKQVRILA